MVKLLYQNRKRKRAVAGVGSIISFRGPSLLKNEEIKIGILDLFLVIEIFYWFLVSRIRGPFAKINPCKKLTIGITIVITA